MVGEAGQEKMLISAGWGSCGGEKCSFLMVGESGFDKMLISDGWGAGPKKMLISVGWGNWAGERVDFCWFGRGWRARQERILIFDYFFYGGNLSMIMAGT